MYHGLCFRGWVAERRRFVTTGRLLEAESIDSSTHIRPLLCGEGPAESKILRRRVNLPIQRFPDLFTSDLASGVSIAVLSRLTG